MFGVYVLNFIIMNILLFKLEILILKFFSKEKNTLQLLIWCMVLTTLKQLLQNGRKHQLLWWTHVVLSIWSIILHARKNGDQFMTISKKIDYMSCIRHNENYKSLCFQEFFSRLHYNFGHGINNMIKEFMGTFWPIFTSPHVLNLMDDANSVYKLQGPNMVN